MLSTPTTAIPVLLEQEAGAESWRHPILSTAMKVLQRNEVEAKELMPRKY